jgi:23S rRNA (guanosine2251-2'-O)-methyltransferase
MKGRKFVNERRRHAGKPHHHLYGLHVIESWLAVSPQRLQRVWTRARPQGRLADVVAMAGGKGVAVEVVSDDQLNQLAGTGRHQGIVAQASEFHYATIEEIASARPSVAVALDQIQDPRNLGAIVRTAAAAAAGGVILPKDGTVGVTATVEVAAAGAAARLPIARVTNLVRSVKLLRQEGYWVIGLDARAEVGIFDLDVPSPTLLVIGGESGIRPLLASTCDQTVSIPMTRTVESLNVSVAAAIALYQLSPPPPPEGRRAP